jgi:hypothetical protein
VNISIIDNIIGMEKMNKSKPESIISPMDSKSFKSFETEDSTNKEIMPIKKRIIASFKISLEKPVQQLSMSIVKCFAVFKKNSPILKKRYTFKNEAKKIKLVDNDASRKLVRLFIEEININIASGSKFINNKKEFNPKINQGKLAKNVNILTK